MVLFLVSGKVLPPKNTGCAEVQTFLDFQICLFSLKITSGYLEVKAYPLGLRLSHAKFQWQISAHTRSVFTESVFFESAFFESVFFESVFSKIVFSKSVFSESVFSKSVFSKKVFIISFVSLLFL